VVATSRRFPREIESLGAIHEYLDEFSEIQKIDARTTFCIRLVVEELFTNMVRHNRGGGEEILVALDRIGDRLDLELVDSDVEPFDPDGVAAVAVAAGAEEREPGGLGVHLVRTMVDSLDYHYETEGRRMRVEVSKTLER